MISITIATSIFIFTSTTASSPFISWIKSICSTTSTYATWQFQFSISTSTSTSTSYISIDRAIVRISCYDKRKKEEEKEKVLDEIDDKIYELPDLPKLELEDQLLNTLGAEVEVILEGNFVTSEI